MVIPIDPLFIGLADLIGLGYILALATSYYFIINKNFKQSFVFMFGYIGVGLAVRLLINLSSTNINLLSFFSLAIFIFVTTFGTLWFLDDKTDIKKILYLSGIIFALNYIIIYSNVISTLLSGGEI